MGAVRAHHARVTRVSGPLVEVAGLPEAAMLDLVELGPRGLPGEIVAIRGDAATVQAYEYTGGLRPGDTVRARGAPLSAPLGPHLLGGVFDGLLRPLATAGPWLEPGGIRPEGPARCWEFTPEIDRGAIVGPGTRVGTVHVPGPVPYRVLVPPGVRGRVEAVRPAGGCPADAPVARVAGHDIAVTARWPVRRPRPYRERRTASVPLLTGQRVVDGLFPLARGDAAAVPGGFGTGKTVLLQQIAKWCDADVIVYVGCGERGNELADVLGEFARLTDPRTGGPLAQRTVVVANTSNMPLMAREVSVSSGVTVAEHFRDMGLCAVVIADSTSRWAEALREFAARAGEPPAEEGYPAGLASALAAFYERAGPVVTTGGTEGSVTIIGAVSPPGGDMTEPVTAQTQRFVRCVWALDRDLAYARHYPAVSWAESFSLDVSAVAAWHARHGDPGWAERRARVVALLAEADRLGALAELVGAGALPGHERVVLLAGRLLREGVLRQSALSPRDASCDPARAAALTDAVLDVVARCAHLVDQEGAPVAALEEEDFSGLLRAREDAATPEAVRARRDDLLARLAARATAGEAVR